MPGPDVGIHSVDPSTCREVKGMDRRIKSTAVQLTHVDGAPMNRNSIEKLHFVGAVLGIATSRTSRPQGRRRSGIHMWTAPFLQEFLAGFVIGSLASICPAFFGGSWMTAGQDGLRDASAIQGRGVFQHWIPRRLSHPGSIDRTTSIVSCKALSALRQEPVRRRLAGSAQLARDHRSRPLP